MATVHPSRMGLIPRDVRESRSDRTRGRSPSPRRSRSRDRDRVREQERGRDSGRRSEREAAYRASEPRRASPQYEDYRRPPPPATGESSAPWRQKESMYPPPHLGRGGTVAFQSFLDERRAQRAAQTVNVWPQSPKAPTRELSPKGGKKSKKSKRHRSPSITDSSEEERRREKKERRRERKAREKEDLKYKSRHRSRSRHRDDSEEEVKDDERERRRHKRSKLSSKSPRRTRSKSPQPMNRSRSPSPARMELDKHHADVFVPSNLHERGISTGPPPSSKGVDDSDDEIGPQPLLKKGASKKFDERAYGGSLLRGEGSAMAAFLQDGTESRIPRRGEIGLTSDEIAKYEDVGYVMSGSRHRRMNAVRMRKENQVISAEEKRGILKLQREERERKEAILRDEFNQLVTERLKGQGQPPT